CVRWAAGDGPARNVVTLNSKAVVLMRNNPALKESVERASLVVADGISISLAARLFRLHLPGRVPGIDLMSKLLEIAGQKGIRCYFLGARQEVVDNLLSKLAHRFPGIPVAGINHGYFDRAKTAEIVERIRLTSPQFLFVALGMPEAEIWCHRHGPATGAAV